MKISVLASSYPRYRGDGIAPFVKSISESLQERGHHVEVVAPYDVNVVPDPDAKVLVHRFRYVWSEKFHIMGHARSLNADVKLNPLTLLLLPLYIIAATLKLLVVSKNMGAEVIHNHWVLPNGVPAAITCKLLKIPFVISLHGSDIFVADKNFIFRWVAKWVFSQASYVTACSQELFDRAKKINPGINISLLAWGADPEIFKPINNREEIRRKYGWSKDEVIIIALGRFVYKKGFDRLISIVPDLLKNNYNFRVVIGGSGPLEKELNNLVEKLGIGDHVSFPGQIPWDEVPDFLAAADIFVLPSQRDKAGNLDGLPTVLLEAMACGLMCVASDIGGVRLVIQDQNNGFIIDQDDQLKFVEILRELLNNQRINRYIGGLARQSVLDKYNWLQVAVEFEKLLYKSTRELKKTRLGQLYRVKYLKKFNMIFDGEKVIEIGCHDARMLSDINASFRVGLDIDPGIPTQKISMIKADGCYIPLPDNSFNVIYLLDVIEHVEDDEKLVNEALRILQTGGKLILTTPHIKIRIFPPFLTGWISVKWGHALRRGYNVEQMRLLFYQKAIINIYELKAKWYRKLYLLLKFLFVISPKLAVKVVDVVVNQESKDPYGCKGFLLVEVIK
jgi:glycosyltransferase involved in cell wall biosynthesis/ubiquinone/menaquinone biosynthesis C-methylase UbiE